MDADQSNAMGRPNADWTYTEDSEEATEQVRRWSHRWVALAGCESPADVAAACYFPDVLSDSALSTLLQIVNGRYEGGDLAARLLLRSLLGPAVREHLRRHAPAFDNRGDAAAALVAALVDAIATYPLGRRIGVKRHLLDRAGTAFRRQAGAARGRHAAPCDPAALAGTACAADESTTDPLVAAAETLAVAMRREAINLEHARLVSRRHAFAH